MPDRPPPFDFKTLAPDVPVQFTLLKEVITGRKDGADYDWHLYPCSYAGNEIPVFTPNEKVHEALQGLKVEPQGSFTLTKRATVNTKTGKAYSYYLVEYNGQTVSTDDTAILQAKPKPEGQPADWEDVPVVKEPKELVVNIQHPVKIDYVEEFGCYYGPIMTTKLRYIETRINIQKLTDAQFAEILVALDKSTSANVSTILIQNGGRR